MAASSSSSTGGEQQYSLRWNDFQSSILSSVRQLRDVEDFVDVTLACDSCSFTAHKIVLSACSPYFRNLLKSDPSYRIVERRRYPCMIKTTKDFRFDLHNNVVFANGDPPVSRETQSITSTYRRDVVNSQWYLSENLFPSYAFAFDRSSSSSP
ncbi:ABRU protein, partial [Acromyrmex charruanus]